MLDRGRRQDARADLTRRDFLSAALLFSALARLEPPAGRLVRTIPFVGGSRLAPLDRLLGDGLDARQFTDLSSLSDASVVTPAEHFFIRTAASPRLPPPESWTVSLHSLASTSSRSSSAPSEVLDRAALERMSRPARRSLIECAGNSDPMNYGLISVADWEGVPLETILDRIRPPRTPYRVLVSGFDDDVATSRTSIPGASWIFDRAALGSAVLALRMNGVALPRHHGAPVRLIVPGWYGCACIKWVNRIEIVDDASAATSQMVEFAERTHQPEAARPSGSTPVMARDFMPATIDTAAVPIRIEQWDVDNRTEYRVAGILWGGDRPTNALAIRFRSNDSWHPVDHCPLPSNTQTWSLWTHTWRPSETGRYELVLKVMDPSIRTRRLDLFYYVRKVDITAV